jgi:hypothetical protein
MGNGGKWQRACQTEGFYIPRRLRSLATSDYTSPTPPLPCHVAGHVANRIRTEYRTNASARPAIHNAEGVSGNLDRPCVCHHNVVRRGGHRSTGAVNISNVKSTLLKPHEINFHYLHLILRILFSFCIWTCHLENTSMLMGGKHPGIKK